VPKHVDLEAVHLPDLHGDDGALDVERQLPFDLFLEFGNRLPGGHNLHHHRIGDLPVRQDGHQPGQVLVFPHLDAELVPGSDPVVRFGGSKEMMRLDIGYARKRAFLLDVTIVLKTIPAIVVQVADRPSSAHARAKELSAVTRLGAVLFAILVVYSPSK
jgi:hypothetical protein